MSLCSSNAEKDIGVRVYELFAMQNSMQHGSRMYF